MKSATFVFLFAILLSVSAAIAQDKPPALRENAAPEQLLSMSGDTPFLKAMQIFSASFKRFASKPLVFDEVADSPGGSKTVDARTIGINIPNMHWHDAFDLVLRMNAYGYIENADYVKVFALAGNPKDSAAFNPKTAMSTREVGISAIFFEANRTQMEQMGINWSLTNTAGSAQFYNDVSNVEVTDRSLAASATTGSSGTGSSGTGSTSTSSSSSGDFGLFSKLSVAYKAVDIIGKLKALQSENLGELISSPSITVRSGEVGRIHVGQDFSVKQRDFSGNTTEKFYSAGTIIDVTHEQGLARIRASENFRRAKQRVPRPRFNHREQDGGKHFRHPDRRRRDRGGRVVHQRCAENPPRCALSQGSALVVPRSSLPVWI